MNLREALFSPRPVAVVGQSDDPGKTAGRPLKYLRQMGYGGRIYPVNPRRESVLVRQLRSSIAARVPGATASRVLVQPMLRGLGEALVGYRLDCDVGPLVLVSQGGVRAEIAADRSLRLPPVEPATARAMLTEVRGFAALSGYRGLPKADLEALAQAIVALPQLAHDPGVAEAESNPLIVLPAGAGVIAVDALVKLSGTTPSL